MMMGLAGPNPNNNSTDLLHGTAAAEPPTSLSLSLGPPLPPADPDQAAAADEVVAAAKQALLPAEPPGGMMMKMKAADLQPSPPLALPHHHQEGNAQLIAAVRQMVREEVQRACSLMAAAAWAKQGHHR
jgi:hypothetical protein